MSAPGARPGPGADLWVRCLRGIEWLVAVEAEERCRATVTSLGHREVLCRVDRLDRRPLGLATADDVFLLAEEVGGVDRTRASLGRLQAVSQTAARRALDRLGRVRQHDPARGFEVVASFLGPRNYNRFELEDAAGAALEEATGLRYRSRSVDETAEVELTWRLHVRDDRALLGLRLPAAPLHRRTYRRSSRPGSLHPPLARAMAELAGVLPGHRVLDPFCGAGTVAIEAWRAQPEAHVAGSDRDRDAVALTGANAARAGARLWPLVADAAALPLRAGSVDRLVANTPWTRQTERTGHLRDGLGPFWPEAARVLGPDGAAVLLLGDAASELPAIEAAGLRVHVAEPVSVSGRWVTLVALGNRDSESRPRPELLASRAHWSRALATAASGRPDNGTGGQDLARRFGPGRD